MMDTTTLAAKPADRSKTETGAKAPGAASSETAAPEPEANFAFASLAAVRNKLLDLSARNPLLNYRHPQAGCVRVIDELPDQIFRCLCVGKAFHFVPVPDPTQQELIDEGYLQVDAEAGLQELKPYPTALQWATHLGLDVSFELPEAKTGSGKSKHQDLNIQTLLYATELEARLRDLRLKAETAIEESGSQVLYLVMGFLEWHETKDTSEPRLAPLFTLPVRLERARLDQKSGLYRYMLTLKDDALLSNHTLSEKLSDSFSLLLPALEEGVSPEHYFQQISSSVLQHQPQWTIRRMATLAILNFTKQAMYQDLDPQNWPADRRIEDHPVISRFFSAISGRALGSAKAFREEHPIDSLEDVHLRYPVIYDADSSQHSAMIDAVNGEDLVIEGPPGSGKSQTITNLIAACIANGKRVLFVAEKMAALNVVKDRLDRAGLGDFCLELHSHKTQKQQLLEELKARLDKQDSFANPQTIDDDIARVEDLRNKLKDYAELINSKWKFTGLTLHTILNRAARLREQLKLDPETVTIDAINGDDLSQVRQRELLDHADILVDVFNQLREQVEGGLISGHHWFGVNNTNLMGYEEEELHRHLNAWTRDLHTLAGLLEDTAKQCEFGVDTNMSLTAVHELAQQLGALPELNGNEPLAALPVLMADAPGFEAWLEEYNNIFDQLAGLGQVFKAETLTQPGAQAQILEQVDALKALGLKDDNTPVQAYGDFKKMKDAEQQLRDLSSRIAALAPRLPEELQGICNVTEAGLFELTTLLRLAKQLPSELWRQRDPLYDAPQLDSFLVKMSEIFRILKPLHQELGEHFDLARLPLPATLTDWRDRLANTGFFSFLSPGWRNARKGLLALANSAEPNETELVALLQKLVVYRKGLEQVERLNQVENILGERFQGMDTQLDSILELRRWYKAVREEYGQEFERRTGLGNCLIALDVDAAQELARAAGSGLLEQAQQLLDTVVHLRQRYSGFEPIQDPTCDLAAEQSPLRQLLVDLHKPLRQLLQHVGAIKESLQQVVEQAQQLDGVQQTVKTWTELPMTRALVPDHLPLQLPPGNRDPSLMDLAWSTCNIAKAASGCDAIINALRASPTPERYAELRTSAAIMQERVEWAKASQALFVGHGEVNEAQWFAASGEHLRAAIQRNERAGTKTAWLSNWLDYVRLCKKLAAEGLQNIVSGLEAGQLRPAHLGDVVQLAMYHQLAKEVLREHPTLDRFSGFEQTALRGKFQEYDTQLMQLQRQRIAYRASRTDVPPGNGSGKVGSYTDAALIRHEANKKTRHIAVRNLLGRAGEAVAALKPCFMMSPMSVAQYLAPGQFQFDIVIMDEASQIRPEDALGAIARGQHLVVVGDPKQLPPTSFFQKLLGVEEDEDTVALEQSESILDTVTPMFRTRRLRWHYRSRHESLIAFSNLHFYNSDLVLFPSPVQHSEEFGVGYQRVPRGRFVRGKNAEEARVLALAAGRHLLECPQESLGLVAMNSEQRDEIERHIEEMLKQDPHLRAAYDRNQAGAEPLFIKNLENVQGDERDVIMISMTYGPNEVGGKVHQRFGPINADVGWRRLNVLFTRSKKRMQVFSSMNSNDVQITASSKKGVISLRAFLEYCETGQLQYAKHLGRTQGSDFQTAMMHALAKHGYACESQLGVAGYYLDLAVKDPGQPNRYLMGIECDGAAYHSARSTRDRDRLRQQVLEGLGWRIRRIWSTDWFKNPEAQLQPILQELAKLQTPRASLIDGTTATEAPIEPADTVLVTPLPAAAEDADIPAEQPHRSLLERLQDFNKKVILPHSQCDEQRRLLRPGMLEALAHHLPTSREEFAQVIPHYLRDNTDSAEMEQFLDKVLTLVADYG